MTTHRQHSGVQRWQDLLHLEGDNVPSHLIAMESPGPRILTLTSPYAPLLLPTPAHPLVPSKELC